jgi:hypothetical protein
LKNRCVAQVRGGYLGASRIKTRCVNNTGNR